MIFIARINGVFAGHIMVLVEKDGYLQIKNEPWITALFVREEWRKQGIGKVLVEHAKTVTRKL